MCSIKPFKTASSALGRLARSGYRKGSRLPKKVSYRCCKATRAQTKNVERKLCRCSGTSKDASRGMGKTAANPSYFLENGKLKFYFTSVCVWKMEFRFQT